MSFTCTVLGLQWATVERFLFSFCFPRAILCDGVHFALSCFSGCLPGCWRGVHVVFHVNHDVVYIHCAWIDQFLFGFVSPKPFT